ncbi:MAG: chromosome segregation protein SMC [Anaerolineales bacterium]
MPLRLKSLELQGYKTFASRTVFEFAEGITAIVGPNGSGKSNIADALRWVLGEQSFGLLRAKKTEDMIFAGSEHRPRAGMASASILFDNTDGWLPVDFSEVSMGRRAYRDGRNEYLLNGQHVRLREINELLAQSGLGERTYTILGQGLVDASLALKADERRHLFEEAAGVGLYRSRREEALRRLETTQHNLERVLDIMAELEPRLRSLERQARRALEYSRVQADLRLLLREWYGYHWHKALYEVTESREVLRQQEARQREARENFQAHQAEYVAFRERLQGLRARLNTWHRQSSDLHSRWEAASRELAVLEERQRALLASRQSLGSERDRLSEESTLASERLQETDNEYNRAQENLAEARASLTSARQALTALQTERSALEGSLRTAREQLAGLTARRAETQARLDELTTRRLSLGDRFSAAEQAIREAEEEVVYAEGERRAAATSRQKAEAALRAADEALNARRQNVSALEEEKRAQSDQLATLKAEWSRQAAQLEVLEQAEQSLSGYAEGARFLLEAARSARLPGARGALSAALDVPAELETAIAAALGESLDAVLLQSNELEEALSLLDAGESGRAALLPLDALNPPALLHPPADPDCLGLAASLVEAPDDLRVARNILLGHTFIVRNRSAARRLLNGQPPYARAVTLRGEVFRADGLVLAGKTGRGSTLSRPRQRRELQDALTALGERVDSLQSALRDLTSNLLAAQEAVSAAESDQREARARFEAAESAEREAEAALDSAQRALEWQKKQLEALQAEASRTEAEGNALLAAQAALENESMRALEEVHALEGKLSGMSLEEAQGQTSYWTTRAAVAEQALGDVEARLRERRVAVSRLEEQIDTLSARLETVENDLAALEQERVALHEKEGRLAAEIAALQARIEPAEKDLGSAEEQERRLQQAEAEAQHAMTLAERQYNQVQVEVIRRQEALETLRGRIQDDFGLVNFEYARDVSGPMPLPLDGMVEQLPVVKELSAGLEEQLTQQRAQLRRMGPINPEAQQEFESESERYAFMKTQVEDLRQAEADLRQVIAELDELTRQEFSKTFEAVDREFRSIFVRLFGGGSARLALTDPENLVETGIEIEARLPGRREQGLALLSGGERSLTAIALVFALLKVSPTPVCVMDEVDAMLDEANVGRFRDLLQELSRETQFIVITHNRNTVQAADIIYGVTMGRDSASQIISLKLDEVTDEFIGR